LVVGDADLHLPPPCAGRRWIRGGRPELYDILTKRVGGELSPRQARFSEEPVGRLTGSGRADRPLG